MNLGLLKQGDRFVFMHCRCWGIVSSFSVSPGDVDIVVAERCDRHRGMFPDSYVPTTVSAQREVRTDLLAVELEDRFA